MIINRKALDLIVKFDNRLTSVKAVQGRKLREHIMDAVEGDSALLTTVNTGSDIAVVEALKNAVDNAMADLTDADFQTSALVVGAPGKVSAAFKKFVDKSSL